MVTNVEINVYFLTVMQSEYGTYNHGKNNLAPNATAKKKNI